MPPVRCDGFSPQKDVRRSTRERATLYASLQENRLGMNHEMLDSLIGNANRLRDRELRESQNRPTGYTRSGRKIHAFFDDGHSSDEDALLPRKSTRRHSYREDVLEAIKESRLMHERELRRSKPKPETQHRSGPSRRLSQEENDSNEEEVGEEEVSLYDRVKRERRQASVERRLDSPKTESPKISPSTSRNLRHDRRMRREEPEEEKDEAMEDGEETNDKPEEEGEKVAVEDEEDEVEEEAEEGPRQYSLRARRPPPKQQPIQSSRSLRLREFVREGREPREDRRSRRRHRSRRRNVRSDSDSTGDDEERFERRKDRSMAKHRGRFMPINMTQKELALTENALVKDKLRQIGGASCSDIDPMSIDSTVGFEQIGGLGPHIQSLKEVVLFPMLYPEVFSRFNINPPKGVIFYGPPGTGKTMVARALANECRKGANKVAFFMRKGADCLSKWVGESERQLRLLFDQAYQMRPSIIFFDEIDGLAPVRSSKQDQIHASIVSTLLALMDGLDGRGEVVVIGATNRLDTIDPALRRPGRFDRELNFSLPDRNARRQILNIHTSDWNENKPTDSTLDAIADSTSGYCGADLKFLCTESVLIALRSRYPHIYMTSERLVLDMDEIRVERSHFESAMRRITPASRRDLTIPSRPLDERTCILLGDLVKSLIATRIPEGYRFVQTVEATAGSELEKVVRALEQPPTVPAVRLLLCGSAAVADAGQTSFVLPAILSKLDHLPVFSLSVSVLLNDGRPEEALSHVVQGAIRAATNGPCIILLPSIDEWEHVVPPSVLHMLTTCLDSMTGFTPVLFLATLDSEYDGASDYVKEIFRPANCVRLPPARRNLRVQYFDHIVKPSLVPPKVFDASLYKMPLRAIEAEKVAPTRKLSEAEGRVLEKTYESLLRQMRIFLRDKLNRLVRDRRFVDFVMPVDAEDAADYHEIIENPICLADIMEKIDNKEYIHADQFLEDVRLITKNALEYNPVTTQDGKTIRHYAIGLRDVTEELIDTELDENFVENLEATSRLLQEGNVTPANEKLIEMPSGFVRSSPWSINNSLKAEIEKWKKEKEKEAQKLNSALNNTEAQKSATNEPLPNGVVRKVGKRKRWSVGNSGKRKKSKSLGEPEHSREAKDDEVPKTETLAGSDEDEYDNEVSMDGSLAEGISPETSPKEKLQLVISQHALKDFVEMCVEKSEGWSVSELERLAAVISHHIEQYRDKWDRSSLIGELRRVVSEWVVWPNCGSDLNSPMKDLQNGIL
ncbi:unnamed protein product [Caenorhabditis auriculariae]|uniref:Tat-binding homolog 7 n=1 Tax=Caenorhabditis auriculariae TaxID=2777116 RepID=A0A8S1HTT9_9PELO|nr:unnamed protein product [Caenorhabditis auriculariae]